MTIESVGRTLDPHFDIAGQLAPFLRDLMMRRFRPDRILSQTVRTTEDLRRIATLLPDLLSQSLESIRRGELGVRFDLQGFERLVRQLTRASNSLTVGIVAAGLFVASSLLYRAGASALSYGGLGDGPDPVPLAPLEHVARLSAARRGLGVAQILRPASFR